MGAKFDKFPDKSTVDGAGVAATGPRALPQHLKSLPAAGPGGGLPRRRVDVRAGGTLSAPLSKPFLCTADPSPHRRRVDVF